MAVQEALDGIGREDNLDSELDAMRACARAIEPLTEDAKIRTLTWLVERYGRDEQLVARHPTADFTGSHHAKSSISQQDVTAKRFVQEKAPQTDVERIAVLAYYLSNYRGVEHFKTADLTALNTEAAQRKFSNAADAASNALKGSGFLADAGKGMRQLTAKGEEAVEALPNREALKAVMDKYASPRRRRPVRGGTRTKVEE